MPRTSEIVEKPRVCVCTITSNDLKPKYHIRFKPASLLPWGCPVSHPGSGRRSRCSEQTSSIPASLPVTPFSAPFSGPLPAPSQVSGPAGLSAGWAHGGGQEAAEMSGFLSLCLQQQLRPVAAPPLRPQLLPARQTHWSHLPPHGVPSHPSTPRGVAAPCF